MGFQGNSGDNLALGKATAQSSTYNYNSTVTGVSGNAVDGNPNTDFQNGHCSHTNAANPSWWRLDLGADLVPVSEIFIVNRFSSLSSLQQRNNDYKITLGSSSDVTKNDECKGLYSFVDFKASAVCYINPLITGRYVGIMTTMSQILQLCEVEVYSRENLAFGKPTNQFPFRYKDARSSKAVDGNSNTHFMRGEAQGSCTMTQRQWDVAPWWRVDLQQVEHVSEVYIVSRGSDFCLSCLGRFKNFEITVGMEGSGQSSANPKCGDTYKYQFPVGEGRSFFCHPSLKGRYVIIRFVDRDKPLTLCEVEVYSERRACPMQAIGVASNDAFPDNSFSASSTSGGNEAFKGRLNGDDAWLPSGNSDPNDYLQIDLLYEFVICAVATQGNPTSNDWTTKYKLQLALTDLANNWFTYQENSVDKVFNGNSGKDDIVKHSLKEYASARFIRFQATTYNNHKALRVEVFGMLISAVPSQAPSGFTVAASTSTSITASWQLPPKYARHGTITGFKLFYRKKDFAGSPTELTNNVTTFTRVISMLDKYTEYEFHVLAFTSKGDGPKSSVVVERTMEDVPSHGPENVTATEVNYTTFEVTWAALSKNVAHGVVKIYQVRLFLKENCTSAQSELYSRFNTTTTNMVLSGLSICAKYEVSVRGYTAVGPGPYSRALILQTLGPCKYVTCSWNPWGEWSETCGHMTRQRTSKVTQHIVNRPNCKGLQTTCPAPQTESAFLSCCKVELGVIMDESGSIDSEDFDREKNFVAALANGFSNFGPNGVQMAVITYATTADLDIKLSQHSTKSSFIAAVKKIKQEGGWTCTVKALMLAKTGLFQISNGARPGVTKMLLIVTDGASTGGIQSLRTTVSALRAMSVNIFSVGVGRNLNRAELEFMASEPKDSHLFFVRNMAELPKLLHTLTNSSCQGPTTKPPPAPTT